MAAPLPEGTFGSFAGYPLFVKPRKRESLPDYVRPSLEVVCITSAPTPLVKMRHMSLTYLQGRLGNVVSFVYPGRRNWICEQSANFCHNRGLHLVVVRIKELMYVKHSGHAQHIRGIHEVEKGVSLSLH